MDMDGWKMDGMNELEDGWKMDGKMGGKWMEDGWNG